MRCLLYIFRHLLYRASLMSWDLIPNPARLRNSFLGSWWCLRDPYTGVGGCGLRAFGRMQFNIQPRDHCISIIRDKASTSKTSRYVLLRHSCAVAVRYAARSSSLVKWLTCAWTNRLISPPYSRFDGLTAIRATLGGEVSAGHFLSSAVPLSTHAGSSYYNSRAARSRQHRRSRSERPTLRNPSY